MYVAITQIAENTEGLQRLISECNHIKKAIPKVPNMKKIKFMIKVSDVNMKKIDVATVSNNHMTNSSTLLFGLTSEKTESPE